MRFGRYEIECDYSTPLFYFLTGFSTGGATAEYIALMRKAVGPELGVKASGGVRSLEDMKKMVEAGATRIGASSGVAIMNGLIADSNY